MVATIYKLWIGITRRGPTTAGVAEGHRWWNFAIIVANRRYFQAIFPSFVYTFARSQFCTRSLFRSLTSFTLFDHHGSRSSIPSWFQAAGITSKRLLKAAMVDYLRHTSTISCCQSFVLWFISDCFQRVTAIRTQLFKSAESWCKLPYRICSIALRKTHYSLEAFSQDQNSMIDLSLGLFLMSLHKGNLVHSPHYLILMSNISQCL